MIYQGVDRDKYRSFDYPEDPVIGFLPDELRRAV